MRANVDIVTADELQPPVRSDPEQSESCRDVADLGPISNMKPHDMRRDEQAPAGIDLKIATVDSSGIDVLNNPWFACRRIDPVHCQGILAAREHLRAVVLYAA